jgi:hypothetical protein
MSEPTFAIVITAYEAADTIAAAVDSALAQTRPAEEVIVVDDGSNDDLAAALQPYEGKIKVTRRPNGGGAAARNTGAEVAQSDFMAVLDADDAYHPRRLEVIAALAAEQPDLDLITTDARLLAQGQPVGTFATFTPFVWENQRTAIFWTCFVGGWPAIRLRRLEAIGGFDEQMRIAYDWDCWLRCILDGARAGFVDEPYYDYVLHQGSLSASRAPSLWERARLLEKAQGNPSLRADEQPELEQALRMHRSRAVDAETQAALYGGGGRSKLGRLSVAGRLEPRARLGAALGFLAPPLARRLVHEDRPAEERLPATAA